MIAELGVSISPFSGAGRGNCALMAESLFIRASRYREGKLRRSLAAVGGRARLPFADGESVSVPMPDGGTVFVKRLEEEAHDPRDKRAALDLLARDAENEDEFLTGLVYIDPEKPTISDLLELTDDPLNLLPIERLRPSREQLAEFNASLA